jgi:type II secretory pathway pseudopilin PulG
MLVSVRRATLVVPMVGILMAVALPLTRYVQKRRAEESAIQVLQQVREAQQAFRRQWGGYASDVDSLVAVCGSGRVLDPEVFERLRIRGYGVSLRARFGAARLAERDCRGREMAADYYVAIQPTTAGQAGQQAFASGATGDIYIFYDGIAPSETDIANGLATPLSQRSSFRIP